MGASVSGADIAYDLVDVVKGPLYAVIIGHQANSYFGEEAFAHPSIAQKPSISHIETSSSQRTIYFSDGTSVDDVDEIIFGTGYSWSLPSSLMSKSATTASRVYISISYTRTIQPYFSLELSAQASHSKSSSGKPFSLLAFSLDVRIYRYFRNSISGNASVLQRRATDQHLR